MIIGIRNINTLAKVCLTLDASLAHDVNCGCSLCGNNKCNALSNIQIGTLKQ